MSRKYYYLGASLPFIQFETEPLLSAEEFLTDCEKLLNANDFALIRSVILAEGFVNTNNATYKAYKEFDHGLRNEIVIYRSEKWNKDASQFLRGSRIPSTEVTSALDQASRAENPLEAEKVLDRIRWQFLDDLSQGHYYDLDFILVYGLKLLILKRQALFASDAGDAVFEEIKNIEIPNI